MKTTYKGYTVEITTKQKAGHWAAEVLIWALDQTMRVVSDQSEVEGYNSEDEAEAAALLHARTRIDTLAASTL